MASEAVTGAGMTEGQGEAEAALGRATTILTAPDGEAPSPARMAEVQALGDRIVDRLKTVFDPEIPVNIYELGLVYKVDIEDDNSVVVDMTLTSPNCPVAETLPGEVRDRVETAEGVKACTVNIVWEPIWNPTMMSEEAQLELGMVY